MAIYSTALRDREIVVHVPKSGAESLLYNLYKRLADLLSILLLHCWLNLDLDLDTFNMG